jgi:uncharacterized RDD family membrane protein YckC
MGRESRGRIHCRFSPAFAFPCGAATTGGLAGAFIPSSLTQAKNDCNEKRLIRKIAKQRALDAIILSALSPAFTLFHSIAMENVNPYAPPAEPAFSTPLLADVLTPEPASQGKRFLNFIIDRVVTFVLASASGFMIGLMYAMSRSNPSAPLLPGTESMLNIIDFVQSIFVALAYYFLCEALFGRTLGKLLTGTRVVNEQGGIPTVPQLIGRTFARAIPLEAFSFLGSRDGSGPVGWHDSLSKTRVINVR